MFSYLTAKRTQKLSHPGGCELGARPIDYHLKALIEMGTQLKDDQGFIICTADDLKGTRINLDFPSVGATENIMLSAVFAKGKTIVTNAAREPEISDLQQFLNAMGARIVGAGTDTIIIDGLKDGETLHNVEYRIMPDRIVAGTYMIAAAITGGEVILRDVIPAHLYPITSRLAETGCLIVEEPGLIYLKGPDQIKPIDKLQTHPHPGFPTDLQPQITALLTLANGTSVIYETVFESRNKHAGELKRMGANIILNNGIVFVIKGVKELLGATVTASDLRCGAALILAGLSAKGNTIVQNSEYVERGYEKIEDVLTDIGADIKLVP